MQWRSNGATAPHAPCASIEELRETYASFAGVISERGYANKTIFRSLMAILPDVQQKRWRWRGFANCEHSDSDRAPARPGNVIVQKNHVNGNPCPAVAAPTAHQMHTSHAAEEAWGSPATGGAPSGAASGAASRSAMRFADAYSVVQASPSANIALPDGLHPETGSDESLAINELLLGAICALPPDDGRVAG